MGKERNKELEPKLCIKFPRVLAAISVFLTLMAVYSSAALGQLFFFHVVLIRKDRWSPLSPWISDPMMICDASKQTGPRINVPRSLRWAACGVVSMSSTSALLVRLFSPECEPQNVAAYDKAK